MEIIHILDDIGAAYTCAKWGGIESDGIPPLLDDGAGYTIFEWFENPNSSATYPLIIFIDHTMTVANIMGSSPSFNVANAIIENLLNDIPDNEIYGCTDPEACNYDESAIADDGSCAYEVDECGVCGGDNTACWFLDISTQIGEVQDNYNTLGMHVAAEDGFNFTGNSDYDCNFCYYDFGEPPPGPGNYILFYFPHEGDEWQNNFELTNFSRDIRNLRDLSNDIDNPSSVWLSVIETNVPMGEINISFDVGNTNLGGNSLIIGYDGTYTAIDMENNATYQFETTGNDELEFIVCGVDNLDENGLDECGNVCGSGIDEGACDCDGNGPSEGYACDGTPQLFTYSISSQQAFYFFMTASIDGEGLSGDDWIGSFRNGYCSNAVATTEEICGLLEAEWNPEEICVGARKWGDCDSEECDVPAMGDDGNELTEGYMQSGDIPTFKIYDASSGEYYDAVITGGFTDTNGNIVSGAWSNMAFIHIALLESSAYSFTLTLNSGYSLISFLTLPENTSVENIFEGISENILNIFTQGHGGNTTPDGEWYGSLLALDTYSGYWIKLADECELEVVGSELDEEKIYDLNEGWNLISFPSPGTMIIDSAMANDTEHVVRSVISDGTAAIYIDDSVGWEGSIKYFEGTRGYWMKADSSQDSFSYNIDTTQLLQRVENPYLIENTPSGFEANKSSNQAFYFIDNIELIDVIIELGDWLISYCNGTVTGSRIWLGETIDIPVFGLNGDFETAGYCEPNDIPHFKLLKTDSNELISLNAEIPSWESNGVFFIGSLTESMLIPESFILEKAYPNPFNPTTTLSFAIPVDSEVSLSVYNLQGREVVSLINGNMDAGYHSVVWNADSYSSGVYFVKMVAGEFVNTQKLMLIK